LDTGRTYGATPMEPDHPESEDELALTAAIYMLRTTQQHHVQLSAMADIKANILITAASILLSASIALTSSDGFRLSLLVLSTGVVFGLFFAVLAVLPKFPRAPRPPGNLLFFGTFAHVAEDEFVDRLVRFTSDRRLVFQAQARDIHQLGSYLAASKYRWLRLAYVAFLVGLGGGALVELVTTLS
jgi:hypothetical protein